MLQRNEKFFEERKVSELIKVGLADISIARLRHVHPRLDTVYEAYAEDINRVIDLAKLPTWLSVHFMAFGMRLAQVIKEETGCFDPSPSDKKKHSENIRLRMMGFETDHKPRSKRKLTNDVYKFTRSALLRMNKRHLEGYDALIPALMILAWTAFERLSEELLEKSVHVLPHRLSESHWRRSPRTLYPWEQMTLTGSIQTQSAIRKRLEYRTLLKIRDSYWAVFGVGDNKIRRILAHRSLDNLHAVRNVVVHKSGRVDGLFLARTAGVTMFAGARKGYSLQLDFGMVKNLVLPVLSRGIMLIAVVNDWIRKHP
jgi:hypothetical protein